MRQQLHFHVLAHLLPVFLLEQGCLEGTQLRPGRADDVAGLALAQEGEVVLADHAAIDHPDALGLAVFLLHRPDDFGQGRDVGAVAREQLVGHRQAFRCHHQSDAHLAAVRTLVARVTALRQRAAGRRAFEVGAGHVVEQELEAHAEPVTVTRQQMGAELFLVRHQHVQSAVEPVVVDLRPACAQQVLQRRAPIPALRHTQFTQLPAKARDREHTRHVGPRHRFAPRLDQLREHPVQV
jgi:hypothetical protein